MHVAPTPPLRSWTSLSIRRVWHTYFKECVSLRLCSGEESLDRLASAEHMQCGVEYEVRCCSFSTVEHFLARSPRVGSTDRTQANASACVCVVFCAPGGISRAGQLSAAAGALPEGLRQAGGCLLERGARGRRLLREAGDVRVRCGTSLLQDRRSPVIKSTLFHARPARGIPRAPTTYSLECSASRE